MWVQKTLYGVNYRWLNKINQDISYFDKYYIKDNKVIELKNKFDDFTKLLQQNKQIIRGKGNKLTIKEIESITGLSKSRYYRIKKK